MVLVWAWLVQVQYDGYSKKHQLDTKNTNIINIIGMM